jgi:hypothetical protein
MQRILKKSLGFIRKTMICQFQLHIIIIIIIIITLIMITSPKLLNSLLNYVNNFYCCTVHFDNIRILFTDKCTLLLNT